MKFVSDLLGSNLTWKLYLSLAIIFSALFYFWHDSKVHQMKEGFAIELKTKLDEQRQELTLKAKETSKEISNEVLSIDSTKQNKIKDINRYSAGILNGLQQRPSRANQSDYSRDSCNAESPEACTGRELSREDAEFLTREATRADQLRLELDSCYKQYDLVKSSIDRFKEENQ